MSFPRRVLSALNYNEQKVQKGRARCIGAGGYLQEAGDMTFYQKLRGLERRNELNDRAVTKTLHVSLNFDPSERLADDVLLAIASGYLERIGFGAQPYLVYRHDDAGHPHLHIVSTTIRADGSRIPTHNLGRHQSERARRELEALFGLVRAEGRKEAEDLSKPVTPAAVHYGKAETKQSLARVVGCVLNQYAFCSLAEYNAALKPFNVLADGGKEGGRLQRHGGLVYRILNERGEKVGVPIKASSLPGKPTLKRIRERFGAGAGRKLAGKAALKEKIDRCLRASPSGLEDLAGALGKERVFLLPHQNGEGRLYGITLVDQQSRCVFKGSDLGKEYTAVSIQARLAAAAAAGRSVPAGKVEERAANCKEPLKSRGWKEEQGGPVKAPLMGILLAPNPEVESVSPALLPKKRRKKKKTGY